MIPGTFIDRQLEAHRTDLLYRVQLKTGEPGYIYILFEHKSSPEPLTPLQLFRYMGRIWTKLHAEQNDRPPLPAIMPLVVYNGTRPWNVAGNFKDLFDSDLTDSLKRCILRF